MCGRFTLRTPSSVLAEHFAIFEMPLFTPRYNIAPTQPVPVIRSAPDGRREMVPLRWGLIPGWAKDPAIGNKLVNARSETAAEKPSFRTAMRRRRCLVAADGFYEWQRHGGGKQAWFIEMGQSRPFAIAGLWESWEGPDHTRLETCTLLTTEPNALMRPIHNRMPVILAPEDYTSWLDPANERPETLSSLLAPYPAAEMVAVEVSDYVNRPTNEGPRCIEPMTGPAPGHLF